MPRYIRSQPYGQVPIVLIAQLTPSNLRSNPYHILLSRRIRPRVSVQLKHCFHKLQQVTADCVMPTMSEILRDRKAYFRPRFRFLRSPSFDTLFYSFIVLPSRFDRSEAPKALCLVGSHRTPLYWAVSSPESCIIDTSPANNQLDGAIFGRRHGERGGCKLV